MFCHLNVHSWYSRMHGIAPIEALLDRAKALGMTHLALTEINGLWGFINFTRLANQAGIAPICGSHILTGPPGGEPTQDLVLLVETQRGYENLCQILSSLHDEPSSDIVPLLERWQEGLMALCPDRALLPHLAQVLSKESLFGELRPGVSSSSMRETCHGLDLQTVITGEVYFLKPSEAPLHYLLRAIDRNERLSQLPTWELKPKRHYFADEAEIQRRYPNDADAMAQSMSIAARCKTSWDFSATIFPGLSPGENAEAILRNRAYAGAAQRYGGPLSTEVRERIEMELEMVCEKGFAAYFLIVADIVKESPLTIGRGSGAASILSYCLLITQVDPVRHNLAFERFLNPDRTDMPDIDIDFAWDERDDVLDYVFEKYGTDQAAMVANHVTLQPRSAVREVAKVYGLSNEEIITVTKRVHLVFAEAGHPTKQSYPFIDSAASLPAASAVSDRPLHIDDTLREVLDLSMKIIGIFHYPSVHAGGVVIVPDAIRNHVPVLTAPKGVQIVEWEKDQVEDSGLVKIDILGNRSLAVVRDCLHDVNLYRLPEEHLAYRDIRPLNDPKTTAIMERGLTMGVFYIESPATRQLLAKAGKVDYDHVVIYSSIIRPAANRYSNLLIERIHGAPWEPLHPDLDFLNESYGIMVYQEQVALSARVLAGWPWKEADMLQKIGTKKSLRPLVPAMQEKFISQSIERGYAPEMVQQVWGMIESFKGYSFTKAHSASYARLSFVCAHLKAHHPAEFMAAVISNRGGFYSPYAYMSEARRLGISVLHPHINRSRLRWKGHHRKIRMGFMEIRNLQQRSIEATLDERKRGDFTSLDDFLQRVDIVFGDTRALIRAGCFDDLEPGRLRPELLLQLMEHHSSNGPPVGGSAETGSIFQGSRPAETPPVHLRELSDMQVYQMEAESFGYPLSSHPLAPYAAVLGRRMQMASDIPSRVGRPITLAGVCLTTKTVKTRKGEAMEFLTFEDQSGLFETVLFPDQYKVFNDLLRWEKLFVIEGKVEDAYGVQTVTIEKLSSLARMVKGRQSQPSILTTGLPGT